MAQVLALFLAFVLVVPVRASSVKQARQQTNQAFKKTSFVAKIDLHMHGKHHVRPDGTPILEGRKGKRQGRGAVEVLRPGTNKAKVRAGERGQAIVVRGGGDQITVSVNKGRSLVNPVHLIVVYDRPVQPSDITPQKIALALSSLIEIDGYEVGQDVVDAFDDALAGAESDGSRPQSSTQAEIPAGLRDLQVAVVPAQVRGGEEVALRLSYTLGAGSGEATETRSLEFAGRQLPNYPLVDPVQRSAGAFDSDFRQRIPASAQPGRYVFKGEVCFAGDCMSRTVELEVLP